MKKIQGSELLMSFFFILIIILLVSGLATSRKSKRHYRMTQASLNNQKPFTIGLMSMGSVTVPPAFAPGQNLSGKSGWTNPTAEPLPVVDPISAQPIPVVMQTVNPSAATIPGNEGRRTSPKLRMLPFQEAHWQGLELIPLIPALARILRIPVSAQGVVVDDVTPPADFQGFQAGDLITSVGQIPTPDLMSFINATDRVRDRRRAEVRLIRNGKQTELLLTSARKRLGIANGEAAPMIKAGSRSPHNYQGPCTECHRIGSKGQLAMDQGDLLKKKAPPILADMKAPHRDRGECAACHRIKK